MKTKLKVMLLLLAGASFQIAIAQTYYINKVWEKELGGYNLDKLDEDGGRAIVLDKDSNIIIVGSSNSKNNGNKTVSNCGGDTAQNYDVWLIKLDQNANILYQQTFGGSKNDFTKDVVINSNGNVVIAANSASNASCAKSQNKFGQGDFWILVLDSLNQKSWDTIYGSQGDEDIRSLIADNNGGYFLLGSNYGSASGGNITTTGNGWLDFLAIKIDSAGAIQWDSLYGSSKDESSGRAIKDANNNYLIIGTTEAITASGNVSTPNIGGSAPDGWLLKIDANGNVIWDERYGCPNSDVITTGIQNYKGNYVIAGVIGGACTGGNVTDTIDRGDGDIWIYEIDSANGNFITDKRIGGNKNDLIYQIIQTHDSGYLLIGRSNSNAGFEKSENCKGYPWDDNWIIRTDSLFNILWDKTIGGSWAENNASAILLNDSTFVLACTSSSDISGNKGVALYDTASSGALSDIWVTKWTVSSINGIAELEQSNFTLYPNPVKDILYVSPKKSLTANSLISITDIQGRVIKEEKISHTNSSVIQIDVSKLSQGVYLLKLNGRVQRFVKM